MKLVIEASAGCNMGNIRENNEDNLYFDGLILEEKHDGLETVRMKLPMDKTRTFCVFDGMGGEEYGETASFVSAETMKDHFDAPEETGGDAIQEIGQLCEKMNLAVCEVSAEKDSFRMGTTMVSLTFGQEEAVMCNIGDSRSYLLRDGEFRQLSRDHSELLSENARARGRKPCLT